MDISRYRDRGELVDGVVHDPAARQDLLVPWDLGADDSIISTDDEGLTSGVFTILKIVESTLRLVD